MSDDRGGGEGDQHADGDGDGDGPWSAWERHAQWWQDGYTDGADPEYEELILPLACEWLAEKRRVLDIGTGEGQLARALMENGVGQVAGVDPAWGQVAEADRRGGGPRFGRAAADALPFATASFDGVLACLVFEHILAMDAAIAEVARVLAVGGRFCFFLNHPLIQTPDSGWIDDHMIDPPEQYWRIGAYLRENLGTEEVVPGVELPFVHRPLHRYINAMANQGLVIEHMAEPAPPPGFLELAREYGQAADIPRMLLLVARRTA